MWASWVVTIIGWPQLATAAVTQGMRTRLNCKVFPSFMQIHTGTLMKCALNAAYMHNALLYPHTVAICLFCYIISGNDDVIYGVIMRKFRVLT